MRKLAVLLSAIFGLLALGGVLLRIPLVAAPPPAPSQTVAAYNSACLTVGPRLLARISRPALPSLEQSTDDLFAGLNEQLQKFSRVRRGRRSVAFQAPALIAGDFLPADAPSDLRSIYNGLRYGRSPPEA